MAVIGVISRGPVRFGKRAQINGRRDGSCTGNGDDVMVYTDVWHACEEASGPGEALVERIGTLRADRLPFKGSSGWMRFFGERGVSVGRLVGVTQCRAGEVSADRCVVDVAEYEMMSR